MICTAAVFNTAKKHAIARDVPSPDFFEGALLGNGGLGVNVCTRPDAVVLYFGHNSIWDTRIVEEHKDKVGTFDEIWDRIQKEPGDVHDAEWYQDYVKDVTASYHDYLYPRPYPAGSMLLYYDRKGYDMLGYSLDISCGLLTIRMRREDGVLCLVKIFVSQLGDTLYLKTTDEAGNALPVFREMTLRPHEPDEGLPACTPLPDGFLQQLPCRSMPAPVSPETDRAFSVVYRCDNGKGQPSSGFPEASGLTVQISEGTIREVEQKTAPAAFPKASFEEAFAASEESWKEYWSRSGVSLADEFLEHIWYCNTYFIRCILSRDSRCPGLFANWMYQNIGTAWHGDYHMNYNTQQVFWGLMGANRTEQHLPYLRLAEDLLPVSRAWAKDFYHLRGACFPHSAYPVPMTIMPYPSPDWGWEIFETPWTVQSLWWHYTYTRDKELLRTRIWPLLKEASLFLADYMTRKGANPLGDEQYHLFPTIVPELYGLSKDFRLNYDGIADLTLTKFLFRALPEAARDLGIEKEEEPLLSQIRSILSAFPEYPAAESKHGTVFLSTPNEDPDHVIYNVPTNLMAVFPGEDIDPQTSSAEELETARRSFQWHYNEGGNDLVFYNLVGARLGVLDLERFKRHIRYSLLPDGTAFDRATLAGGRYSIDTDLSFMGRMGIWIENFSLYAVIDECLLKGHTDIIELFPNWDRQKEASFCSLRTKGAFLVDAACAEGRVSFVRIYSEAGGTLKIKNPWQNAMDEKGNRLSGEIICKEMQPGEELVLREEV